LLAAPGDVADDDEPSKLAGISRLKKFKGDDLLLLLLEAAAAVLLLLLLRVPPPLELDIIANEFRTENGDSLGDGGRNGGNRGAGG
jgi:hypothetical protein